MPLVIGSALVTVHLHLLVTDGGLLLLLTVALSHAAMSPEDEKEVLGYKLSMQVGNKILTALPAMTQYVLSLPDRKARLAPR